MPPIDEDSDARAQALCMVTRRNVRAGRAKDKAKRLEMDRWAAASRTAAVAKAPSKPAKKPSSSTTTSPGRGNNAAYFAARAEERQRAFATGFLSWVTAAQDALRVPTSSTTNP